MTRRRPPQRPRDAGSLAPRPNVSLLLPSDLRSGYAATVILRLQQNCGVSWMHMPLRFAPLLLSLVVGACATQRRSATPSPSADFALDSSALATAIDYGVKATGIEVPLVCVSVAQADPRPELLAAAQAGRVTTLRPGSACHVDTTGGPLTGRSLVTERAGSALRGISVNVGYRSAAADGRVTFLVSYYQHYLSSADWGCTARRRGRQWVVGVCQLERIS